MTSPAIRNECPASITAVLPIKTSPAPCLTGAGVYHHPRHRRARAGLSVCLVL